MQSKREKKIKRKKRIRRNISGHKLVPRVVVYRSNKFIYAHVVDDENAKVLYGFSDKSLGSKTKLKKVDRALESGKKFGEILIKNKVKQVVLDRNGNLYHGRVKAFTDGLRKSGIKV